MTDIIEEKYNFPSSIYACRQKGRLNYKLHRLFSRFEFEKCASEEVSNYCDDEQVQFYESLIMKQEGSLNESQTALQNLTKKPGISSAFVIQELVKVLRLLQGKIKLVQAIIEESLQKEKDNDNWILMHLKGISLVLLNNKEEAISHFKQMLELVKHVDTYKALMVLLNSTGKLEETTELGYEAMEKIPFDKDILSLIGLTSLKLGNEPRAVEYFTRALIKHSVNERAVLGIGNIYQRNGEHTAALVKYRISAAHDASAEVWNNIGISFLGENNMIATVSCLSQARKLAPLNWAIAFNLALVHIMNGNLALGYSLMITASRLNSKSELIAAWLSM